MEQWIVLSDLCIPARIGIHEFERKPQNYMVSYRLKVEKSGSYLVLHDSIEEAIDYDALRLKTINFISSQHFNLQETVIQGLMGLAFKLDPAIAVVQISVAKTSVYKDAASVGLTYMVNRDDWCNKWGKLKMGTCGC